LKITIKYRISLVALVFTITASANDLSKQLKSFNNKLDSEVEKLLIHYADNNKYLNSLEMQQAAFIAAKVDEWEIAGFYCIARPMISALVLKNIAYGDSQKQRNMYSLGKYWQQLDNRLKPLFKNKKFKQLNKLTTIELMACDKVVKLKLINDTSLLKKSLVLYKQWRPQVDENYHHVPTFDIVKSAKQINNLFNQLNEIYVKANQDFIKLLAIPRYKELKLKSYEYLADFTKKVDSGNFDLNKCASLIGQKNKDPKLMAEIKKMMEPVNRKREMEQIEIDNLLFPEIAWGSWY